MTRSSLRSYCSTSDSIPLAVAISIRATIRNCGVKERSTSLPPSLRRPAPLLEAWLDEAAWITAVDSTRLQRLVDDGQGGHHHRPPHRDSHLYHAPRGQPDPVLD